MTKQTFCRVPGPGETRACIDPWIFVFVRSSGDVDACCRGVKIGNLNERSFEEIVNGPEAIELRRRVLAGDLPPGCVLCATRPVTTVETLGALVEHLVYDAGFEEQEELRRRIREHRAVRSDLLREREGLRGHATTLERLLADVRAHASTLEQERPHLLAHIENLERELAAARHALAARDEEAQRRLRLLDRLRAWFGPGPARS
ncbi:MAG: SPASM domain-containing protein [Planctomycetes bacterium]|nr:SPASM domain-containing protein [Planctomycetota bacterium]